MFYQTQYLPSRRLSARPASGAVRGNVLNVSSSSLMASRCRNKAAACVGRHGSPGIASQFIS